MNNDKRPQPGDSIWIRSGYDDTKPTARWLYTTDGTGQATGWCTALHYTVSAADITDLVQEIDHIMRESHPEMSIWIHFRPNAI